MNSIFVKVSALSPKDKSKLKGYWTPLWGTEFSKALTMDYETSGSKKTVKASSNDGTEKKKNNQTGF